LLLAIAGGFAWHARHPVLKGTPVSPPRSARQANLIDQDGHSTEPFGAPVSLVFFGYTNCNDNCPVALAMMETVDRTLGAPAGLRMLFVTTDPARDSPRVLRRYVREFGPRISGLTGSPQQLNTVIQSFGVAIDAESHEVAHGDAIYLVDAKGRILAQYPTWSKPADIVADVRTVAGI
jgi:protein SCO1/2